MSVVPIAPWTPPRWTGLIRPMECATCRKRLTGVRIPVKSVSADGQAAAGARIRARGDRRAHRGRGRPRVRRARGHRQDVPARRGGPPRRRRPDGWSCARGASELERDHSFGVVRQLLEPAVVRADAERREALLEGAASLAAPAVGLAAGGAGDRFAVLHGLYWLVANLAALEDRPLLLVVDDLQWADAPSLGFLAYLVRRLEGLPVAVAAAARPATARGDRAGDRGDHRGSGRDRADARAAQCAGGGDAREARLGSAPSRSSSPPSSRRRVATRCSWTIC